MPKYSDKSLYLALNELQVIDKKALESAFKQARDKQGSLAEILLDKDLIADENLGQVAAELLNLPFVKLAEIDIKKTILNRIPESFAREQKIIVFAETESVVHIAINELTSNQAIDFAGKKLQKNPVLHYATKRDISEALLLYKQDAAKMFGDIIQENVKQAQSSSIEPPIIKIVHTIITHAQEKKASDIHIEPLDKNLLIRFRIDGILHDIVKLPIELHPRIVTRVKVLAKLRTDEHQAAQDGKIQIKLAETNEKLDIRVSIVPATDGEKVVMRLLSERSRKLSLADLGFSPHDLQKLKKAYLQPHGMILATGPTGSGKTTTMYSILKLLNKREVNISTIEDPVEYDIDGITQIQVNTRTELTFAKGLRSIVRQDPDIILVGEIRDEETADIATNAAMTGHLVLSTLHTNDAATAIPRLIDMQVEPFLIASTVNIIIAQRLVRKIHLACRVSSEYKKSDLSKLFSAETIDKAFPNTNSVRTYKGQGCAICNHTGYEGRVGVYEVLLVDDDIRQAITSQKDANTIQEIAIKNGMTSMIDDGLNKVKQGITSIEEVLRVTKE